MPGRDYAYDGVVGGKTGYTDQAGNTLVTFAVRNGISVVTVVLDSTGGAYADTAALLDYTFDNFRHMNMRMDPEPTPVLLPGEALTLSGSEDAPSAFVYRTNVIVTVPQGTKRSAITRKQSLLSNSAGPYRIKSKYYLDDHQVGWGMQYEEKIMPF